MQIAAVNASPLLFRSLVPKSSAFSIQSRQGGMIGINDIGPRAKRSKAMYHKAARYWWG